MLNKVSRMVYRASKQCRCMVLNTGIRTLFTTQRHLARQPASKESLSEQLRARIEVRGPLTVAEYMRAVLTSPMGGYYMERDVFGRQGDFTTSPEISQIFGEMIGIWFVNELHKFCPPNQTIQLVELGPGRASLIEDILRVFNTLRRKERLSVHLVEVSPELSRIQAERLCEPDSIEGSNVLASSGGGPEKNRRYLTERETDGTDGGGRTMAPISAVTVRRPPGLKIETGHKHYQKGVMSNGTPVFWYCSLLEVPQQFSCFLAHEFFDALPIHKFKKTEEGWREILVTSDHKKGADGFKFIISRSGTPSSKVFMKPWDEREEVELCPEGGLVAQQLATRIEENGGIALVVDYGHEGEGTDTFRAFRRHQQVDPLQSPGSADLTADVDFSYLRDAVSDKTVTFGPVSQSVFLKNMGIDVRLKVLLENCSEEEKSQLLSGYDMITSSMGERFKFFSFFPRVLEEHLKQHPVAGFTDVKVTVKSD